MRGFLLFLTVSVFAAGTLAFGQNNIATGVDALRALDPTLTGSGVNIAQSEAVFDGTDGYEVNPAAAGQPSSEFTYISAAGTGNGFPNAVGSESTHADTVGDIIFGNANNGEGAAPGVNHVYNYDADYFFDTYINQSHGASIPAEIVNQSFVITSTSSQEQEQYEELYDNYAAQHNVLFISGAGFPGAVIDAPASAYNGIAVNASDSGGAIGPAYDGRSKPDISAPGGADSYSTGEVSGVAALLLQAAARGDGGAISSATNAMTLKALLLNGAVKPAGWTHTDTAPLDPVYGAGVVNAYNSYLNLKAGQASAFTSASGPIQSVGGGTYSADEGWDLASISNPHISGSYADETSYYEFDLTSATAPDFTLTSTLTWDRHNNQTGINNLDLYLFNADTGAEVAVSDSTIDNVEELYVQNLAPGHYDLAVLKNSSGMVTTSETYALAFNFASVPEPSTWLLIGIAGLPFLARLRRRQ